MSSIGLVETSAEDLDLRPGEECKVEPEEIHASNFGVTENINDFDPLTVSVVEADANSSFLLSTSHYDLDSEPMLDRACSPDSANLSLHHVDTSFNEESLNTSSSDLILGDSIAQGRSLLMTNNCPDELFKISSPVSSENDPHIPYTPSDSQLNECIEDSGESSKSVSAATTTLDYTSIELPDTKEGIEELCPVCGDKVSGYHYGLLTCESCKGFFKRTVQNKKVYTCVADRSCQIDKTQRKRCPFCRFQKCLEVGMKLEAVRADRMRGGRNKFGPMYKRDRARKLQMIRQRQISHPGLVPSRGGAGTPSVGVSYSYTASTASPVKEEIQSPFLSSSTSSPDSSPAPMHVMGVLSSPASSGAVSALAVSPAATGNHTNAMVVGGQELSLWVGSVSEPAPPGPGPPSSSTSSSNGTASIGATNGGGRVPPLIRQLVTQIDDDEWQSSLYSLLQNQTYNQCEVDLFELLCKVLDQNLFSQVDWARNSCFFKDLRVDDQMKLLQHSWSDMLIIDHLHQRIHNKLQDEMALPNGQKFDLLSLALLGTTQFAERFQHIMNKLIDLKFDISDYICIKFILLLNPEVRNLNDRRSVVTAHEQVKQTLIEYCQVMYPEDQDRYQRLTELLPELHYIADNGERYLYFKHIHGAAPSQTLLMEMLHTKRR